MNDALHSLQYLLEMSIKTPNFMELVPIRKCKLKTLDQNMSIYCTV